MAILDRFFGGGGRPAEGRSWDQLTAVWGTGSAPAVTEEGALSLSAVLACVRVLSETVAQLPLFVYERLERGKRKAAGHPLYGLLHDAPNPLMTSFEFRETMQAHLALYGNAYAEIEYDWRGQVVGLWPLSPDKMREIQRLGPDRLLYVYELPSGKRERLDGARVLHVRGLGSDGIRGYSVIQHYARRVIRAGLVAREFGEQFFVNGAQPGGVLQHPGVLSPEAASSLRESWNAAHQGLRNSHRIAVLEEGMTFERIGVPPEEAQFLDTLRMNRADIAAMFRIPPHMIGDLERATFSNIEQQSIEFKTYTMEPWLVRWQQRLGQSLLMEGAERERYFVEFAADALLRGDTISRYQAHSIGRQNGWLSANDIRELENMNPIKGGDVYLVPLNMTDGGVTSDERRVTSDEELRVTGGEMRTLPNGREIRAEQWDAAQARHDLQISQLPLYEDVVGRIVRRERNDIGNAAGRLLAKGKVEEFEAWLADFWERHIEFVADQYRPLVMSAALQSAALAARETVQEAPAVEEIEAFVAAYVLDAATRYVARRRAAMRKWLEEQLEGEEPDVDWDEGGGDVEGPGGGGDGDGQGEAGIDWEEVAAQFRGQLEEWEEEVPGWYGLEESVRVVNALALVFLAMLGVRRKTWVTVGDSCPYCNALAGATIEINGFFLAAGESFFPEGAQQELVVSGNIGHAPAHRGCDCQIVAGE